MTIEMKPVESRQIKEAGRDPETGTVAIRFHTGALYHYADVPADVFARLVGAESPGGFFHQHIRGTYKHTRIDEKKP